MQKYDANKKVPTMPKYDAKKSVMQKYDAKKSANNAKVWCQK